MKSNGAAMPPRQRSLGYQQSSKMRSSISPSQGYSIMGSSFFGLWSVYAPRGAKLRERGREYLGESCRKIFADFFAGRVDKENRTVVF